jgi:hypothetical protein
MEELAFGLDLPTAVFVRAVLLEAFAKVRNEVKLMLILSTGRK